MKSANSDVLRFFHPVLESSQLKKRPMLATVNHERLVLFRDHRGEPAALADRCPHRGAPLSLGRVLADGRIACPYHGWNFDRQGSGHSPSQPSLRYCDVEALTVIERFGLVWVARFSTPLERFPHLHWEGFEFAGSFSVPFFAPLPLALDNFSEDEHFPYVHRYLGWDASGLPSVQFEANNFPDRTEVSYSGRQRNTVLVRILGARSGDRFENTWVTRFDPVHAIFTFRWYHSQTGNERPVTLRTAVFMVPENDVMTRFFVVVFSKTQTPLFQHLAPFIRMLARTVGKFEVLVDAKMVAQMANGPRELTGMRLGKYDKPLIHNRKLLNSLYFGGGTPNGPTSSLEASENGANNVGEVD